MNNNNNEKVLSIRDWRYSLADNKRVSYDICRGKITAIYGSNGSGKSLLVKSIAEVFDYPSGKIERFFNFENCGILLQSPESLIFREYIIDEALLIVGDDIKLAELLLSRIGVSKDRPSLKLSDGQKRLLFIYGYLMSKKVVIFDEPFVSIDSVSRDEIERAFLESKEAGVDIIYTANRRDHLRIADDVLDFNEIFND